MKKANPVDCIVEKMDSLRMNQKEFSVLCNLDQAMLSRIINRKQPITLRTARKIAEGAKIPIEDLIAEEGWTGIDTPNVSLANSAPTQGIQPTKACPAEDFSYPMSTARPRINGFLEIDGYVFRIKSSKDLLEIARKISSRF